MNITKVNYWIDVGLAISFFVCFITGLIKWPGLIKIIGPSLYLFLHVRNITILHDWSGLIMGLLVFVHLALHWKWIKVVTKDILFGRKKEAKIEIK
ncbi:MAG: DUF4405 domain-containing protein [Candidatus Aenigmarchaeota archaeon]|nr:DUF4405 domain-containing protein [Candidatus Aenigmarchaeota archaeon]